MSWFIKSVWSRSGTRLQRDVRCVVLMHTRQNRTLPADAVDEEANGSVAFKLGN